jgi:8-oxo-dGTP pyrophosphatase MutT (NUDIX family)
MTIEATLCAIIDGDRILLQRKGEGRFGAGKWNSPGGKLVKGERPEDGAAREVQEETGLRLSRLTRHGLLRHYFGHNTKPTWNVHIFSAKKYEGTLKGSEEGELRWFAIDSIPYEDMWQDDEHWLPLLLEGRSFNGEFYFNEEASQLLGHYVIVSRPSGIEEDEEDE